MTTPTKNVVDLPVATTVERTDKVVLVDISDTSEGPLGTVKIAETQTVGQVFSVEISQAENAADQAAASAAAAAAITGLSTVQNFTNPLARAIRIAMTAAASGSNGIQVLDNANVNFGTGNFSIHLSLVIDSFAVTDDIYVKGSLYLRLSYIATTKLLRIGIGAGVPTFYSSTVGLTSAAGQSARITVVVVRQSASAAGSVTFYENGVQLGAAVTIAAGTPPDVSVASSAYILGGSVSRVAGSFQFAALYNRALSAAEVLSLSVSGPALADLGASQTPIYTSNLATDDGWTTSGGNQIFTSNQDAIDGEDDWGKLEKTVNAALMCVRRSSTLVADKNNEITVKLHNPGGSTIYVGSFQTVDTPISGSSSTANYVAVPAGQSATLSIRSVPTITRMNLTLVNSSGLATKASAGTIFYFKSVQTKQIGITAQYNAQDAQSDTGQILDSSGNKNHALLPASGATIVGAPVARLRQVRWTNTWSGTNELQYIGGVNQNILPANAYIESIVGVITGATVEDVIIGDGTTTNRYVTITTGLAAGTTTFTLANRTPTNSTALKLTVDPDANATMSIAWTIIYRVLEA